MKSLLADRNTVFRRRPARGRGFGAAVGWTTAILMCWAGLAQAGTYRLQAASVPESVFR